MTTHPALLSHPKTGRWWPYASAWMAAKAAVRMGLTDYEIEEADDDRPVGVSVRTSPNRRYFVCDFFDRRAELRGARAR